MLNTTALSMSRSRMAAATTGSEDSTPPSRRYRTGRHSFVRELGNRWWAQRSRGCCAFKPASRGHEASDISG